MNAPDHAPATFEQDVASVLTRLRSGLAEVIAAVPEQVMKGADLHRALHLDRKLSWKVFRVATSPNPLAAGPHVPSPANLKSFFKAAAKRGVPPLLIESAARVAADFEDVVAVHAGDRATFDSMISGLVSGDVGEQIDLVHRRLAFRGQRHILGIQARTHLKMLALQPAEDQSKLDLARVEGLVSLRRLRADAPFLVGRTGGTLDDGSAPQLLREPIDPNSQTVGPALLQEFCSQPLPEFRIVEAGRGFVDVELVNVGVGNKAALTSMEGHVVRGVFGRYRDDENHHANNMVTVRTPSEVLVVDLLVRDDTFGSINPSAFGFATHLGGPPEMADDAAHHSLAITQTVAYLGKGPSVLHTPDVPRYAELGRYVFDRLRWDGDRFDVYRCRIEYPVVPSMVGITFKLPEPPPAQTPG